MSPVLGLPPVAATDATYRAMPNNTGVPTVDANFPSVVDGTPVRVVVLAFAAAAGLMALKMAGFKFNVGVSA